MVDMGRDATLYFAADADGEGWTRESPTSACSKGKLKACACNDVGSSASDDR